MNLLLKNVQIVTQNDNREIIKGDIWVEEKIIKAVGENLSAPGAVVHDFSGLTVIPGLIQTHVHLCQVLYRNQADDLELLDWLTRYIWPMEMHHTAASLQASAQLGLFEMLSSGVTCILDMGCMHHMEVVFEEMQRCGIRGFSGKVMMDHGEQPYKETTGAAIQSTEALIRQWHQPGERIQYALAPRFVLSCSDALWERVGELSAQYDLIIHTHSSENRSEIALVEQQTGMRNVNFFVARKLASPKLCLAHCIWLDEQEKKLLQDYEINVMHCPGANLKLGSGFAPVPEYLQRGITVSLGSDGAPCNNNLDIFTDMRLAALIHKPNHGVRSISAQDVLDMATCHGARTLGLENQVGSIEPGKRADLAILDLNKVHQNPVDNIVSQIVYSAQSRDVVHVMVDGKWVVQDGAPLAYPDPEELVARARRECAALKTRVRDNR